MAKKDNSPGISFFSFQDIITSITGIMFLVVMMLVLMVLQQSSPVQQKSKQLNQELQKMEKELQQLQASLARIRQLNARQQQRIAELKKLRIETLPALKEKLVRQLQNNDAAIAQLEEEEQEYLKAQSAEKEKARKNQQLAVNVQEKSRELKKRLLALDDELKEKKKIFQKVKSVIRFVWEQHNPRKPVLLECSGTEITASTLDGSVKRTTFNDFQSCLAFCRRFPAADTYFVLLLKPSAFSYGEKFSRELQKAGYQRGREILPDEQTVISKEVFK